MLVFLVAEYPGPKKVNLSIVVGFYLPPKGSRLPTQLLGYLRFRAWVSGCQGNGACFQVQWLPGFRALGRNPLLRCPKMRTKKSPAQGPDIQASTIDLPLTPWSHERLDTHKSSPKP